MEPNRILVLATEAFRERLLTIEDVDLTNPTPWPGWNVQDLLIHVTQGSRIAAYLAQGASNQKVEVLPTLPTITDDLFLECLESLDEQRESLEECWPQDRVVEHPEGDISIETLILLRSCDLTIHAWDLARTLRTYEDLNQELTDCVYESSLFIKNELKRTGCFGPNQISEIESSKRSLERLLELSGRNP
jgi:uncharacterized protein (TIGR03086 family)